MGGVVVTTSVAVFTTPTSSARRISNVPLAFRSMAGPPGSTASFEAACVHRNDKIVHRSDEGAGPDTRTRSPLAKPCAVIVQTSVVMSAVKLPSFAGHRNRASAVCRIANGCRWRCHR